MSAPTGARRGPWLPQDPPRARESEHEPEPGARTRPPHIPGGARHRLLDRCARHTGAVTGVRRLTGGNVSHVFRVEGEGGTVVLKVRTDRFARMPELRTDPALIADERRALEVYGAAAPSLFPRVLDFLPEAHAMIMTDVFPDRRTYQDHLLERPATSRELERLGAALRRVHEATRAERRPIRSQGDVWFREHTFGFCLGSTPHPALTAACGELRRVRGQQLILGDCCPKNLSLAGGGVAICDLDNVHHGWPLYDLGYLLAHVLIHHPGPAAGRLDVLTRALLHGYAGPEGIAADDHALMLKVTAGVMLYRLVNGAVPYELPLGPVQRRELHGRVVALLDHGTVGLRELSRAVALLPEGPTGGGRTTARPAPDVPVPATPVPDAPGEDRR
ncbi:phosphotransferase [Streptomyces sp. ODS28]|uniref:phosphotransferase n=1 Tax=Streptomyces sp. ODS28 TaxID=3136688 RepID=UPI0031F1527C